MGGAVWVAGKSGGVSRGGAESTDGFHKADGHTRNQASSVIDNPAQKNLVDFAGWLWYTDHAVFSFFVFVEKDGCYAMIYIW